MNLGLNDKRFRLIPEILRFNLEAYVLYGQYPGQCLEYVLRNDIRSAWPLADLETRKGMSAILDWLHHRAPGDCWGSPGAVSAWIHHHGQCRASGANL